jgi:Mn-dependent DtxR family transcriptional regulator
MAIYESAEDYLERILMLQKEIGNVRSIDIAHAMGYSKPSISRAIKLLKEAEYIVVENNGIINFTPKGKELATSIYQRHELLTNFLITIGVSEETAKIDACGIEHHLSEETFAALKKHLTSLQK